MRINQGLVKIVQGEKGNNTFKWWRISRTTLQKLEDRMYHINDFYYAKVYEYIRLGTRRGYVKSQIGYIYWKNGVLTTKKL